MKLNPSPIYVVPNQFLMRVFFQEKPSVLKAILCLALVLGDVLIVKPPMMFGGVREESSNDGLSHPYYWFGVLIGLVTALCFAVNSVLIKLLTPLGKIKQSQHL